MKDYLHSKYFIETKIVPAMAIVFITIYWSIAIFNYYNY